MLKCLERTFEFKRTFGHFECMFELERMFGRFERTFGRFECTFCTVLTCRVWPSRVIPHESHALAHVIYMYCCQFGV